MIYGSVCSGIEAATVAWEPLGWQPAFFAEIDKFPSSVLAHHYPEVPNAGDFTTIKGDEYGTIDLLVGGTPCFPADTLVLTNKGLTPIQDIAINDLVLTHTGCYRRVLDTGSKLAETIVLKGQGHHGMRVTKDHPFLASSYSHVDWSRDEFGKAHPHRQFSDPTWIPANQMKGKFWSSPASFPKIPVPEIPDFTPPSGFWWMIGAFLGNGWTRSTQRSDRPEGQEWGLITICTGKKKSTAMAMELSRSGLSFSQSEERTVIRFTVTMLALRKWIDLHLGKYAQGKVLPSFVLGLPAELRREVLNGYAFTDGCTTKAGTLSFNTVSYSLAVGIRLLCQSLGYSVTQCFVRNKREKCIIEGRVVNESPYYNIRAHPNARSSVMIGEHRFGLVRSISEISDICEVFNLEVEDDNSYTADGIIVHNCQDFSIAGLRAGMDGERGQLTVEFARMAHRLVAEAGTRWLAWENVPGVLSIDSGGAFATFLSILTNRFVRVPDGGWSNSGIIEGGSDGFGLAYRILDAQHFGVPQRRRRVFVIGYFGDWRRAAAVLFESFSLSGHPAPSREARKIAPTIPSRSLGGGGLGTDFDCDRGFDESSIATASTGDIAHCLNAGGMGRQDYETETLITHALRGEGFDASEDGTGRGTPLVPVANSDATNMAIQTYQKTVRSGARDAEGELPPEKWEAREVAATLNGFDQGDKRSVDLAVTPSMQVRRLTAEECESLQGFKRGYTKINDQTADGPRYKALGNSMAVPVMRWIGERIQMVDSL